MLSAGPRARHSPRPALSNARRQGSWLSAGLGAVRRVVAAPLSWLGGGGATSRMDVEDEDEIEQVGEDGKRRRVIGGDVTRQEGIPARDSKRRRVGGSEYDYAAGVRRLARQGGAYLDPPEGMFATVPERARTTSGGSIFGDNSHAFTFQRPTMPSDPRSIINDSPPSSFVASSREHSIDSTADSGKEFPARSVTTVFPLSRQATARNSVRELSLPPAAPFHSRTQSAGQPYRMRATPALGVQTVPRHQRAMTPSFLRLSEGPEGGDRAMSAQPTLGDILEQQRASTRSPVRQQNTMLIDQDSMQSWTEWEERRSATPVGAGPNERLLLGLDVFKTPLLPSRLKQNTDDVLRATGSLPDVLRQNKVDVPVGELTKKRRSHKKRREEDDEEDMPKLGLGKKREKKVKESKPYAGEGGTKKILAKIRQDVEVKTEPEEVKVKDYAMEDTLPAQEEIKVTKPAPTKAPAPTVAPATKTENVPVTKNPFAFDDEPSSVFKVGGLVSTDKGASSGRVGREKVSSNSHVPSARLRKSGARFSGRPEDLGDGDSVEMASPPIVSTFAPPKDFSFGPPASGVFAQPAEASTSKQAPVGSLPFTLGAKPAALPTLPILSVTPATPDTTPAVKSGSIPNFFGKSAATKTSVPEPPKMGSLFGGPIPAVPAVSAKAEETKTAAAPTSPFSFGSPASTPASTSTSAFTLGSSTSEKTEAPKTPTPLFGAPTPATTKVDGAPKASGFSFGAPAAPEKAPEPAQSPFTFGAPTPATSTPAPATTPEAPKSGFSFGATTPAATPAAEPPKSGFSFGPSTSTVTAPIPAAEAPKPLFGDAAPKPLFGPGSTTPSFSFGQPVNDTAKEAAPASRGSTPAFTFGAASAAPSTPAPEEKKPVGFTFGASAAAPATPTVTPAPFTFGAAATTPTVGSSSSPFAFGSASTPAPKTPPKTDDNEISMDESPTRGPGLDVYGNAGANKPTSGFFSAGAATVGSTLFGNSNSTAPASSPFNFGAQTPAPTPTTTGGTGFSFGQKAPETPASNTNNPFSFGQQKPEAAPVSGGFGAAASSGGGFNFGNSATPAANSSTGFTFGNGNKVATPAPTSGGFTFGSSSNLRPPAAPPIQTSFSSGPEFNKASSPFTFGGGPTTAPPTSAPFTFGGGASNAGSAPASPSTFAAPAPFAFGSPSVQPVNGFGFGSQPASPAVATTGLPGGGFNFGGAPAVGTPPTSSHGGGAPAFGSPAQSTQPLFNIGAAPLMPTTPGGARQTKKLPQRRKR